MAAGSHGRIFSTRAELVGRDDVLSRLLDHSRTAQPLIVAGKPGVGTSEVLRHLFDRLYNEHGLTIPIYFQVRKGYRSAREVAESFLSEFIRQLVSFRRRDPSIVRSAAGLDELAELSLSVSGIWIDRLIETARSAPDGRSYIRNCLAAPIRAAAHDARSIVIIDDVHRLSSLPDGELLLEELADIYRGVDVPLIVAGHRRYIGNRFDWPRLHLDELEHDDTRRLVRMLAAEASVETSEPALDLAAVQLGGSPLMITKLVVEAARSSRRSLITFGEVAAAYVGSLLEGSIGEHYRETIREAANNSADGLIQLFAEMLTSDQYRIERSLVRRRLRLDEDSDVLERLHWSEIVKTTPVFVELDTRNNVLLDYLRASIRLHEGESSALVFATMLRDLVINADKLLAERYRAAHAVGLREILAAFDGQSVSSALFDYGKFRSEIKGIARAEEVSSALDRSAQVTLPRIFFTTSASAFYKPLLQLVEQERSAIALGFEPGEDGDRRDTVWIAAEIDSKLEAQPGLTEFWCDRLEAAAVMCGFERYKVWLVTPEGFSPEAVETLRSRNAYGSSRRQAEMLRQALTSLEARDQLEPNEYEIVVPMGDDAELVAAHAVEEIARRHALEARAINQIKTALVEACINASEHSLSPDRRIFVRFRVEDDRIVLTVSNRGLRLVAASAAAGSEDNGRRGWGLKLMRKLMDDVRIEDVDGGTRLVLTKKISG